MMGKGECQQSAEHEMNVLEYYNSYNLSSQVVV